MATIGGNTVYSIRGRVPISGYVAQDLSRPGIDGHAKRIMGRRGQIGSITSITKISTGSSVGASEIAQKNLQATVVSITDDLGETWNNMWIESVRTARVVPVLTDGDGSNTAYLLFTQWNIQPLSTSY